MASRIGGLLGIVAYWAVRVGFPYTFLQPPLLLRAQRTLILSDIDLFSTWKYYSDGMRPEHRDGVYKYIYKNIFEQRAPEIDLLRLHDDFGELLPPPLRKEKHFQDTFGLLGACGRRHCGIQLTRGVWRTMASQGGVVRRQQHLDNIYVGNN